jgi:anti-sigma regulatory factor (Ser/Thr protein kinase)
VDTDAPLRRYSAKFPAAPTCVGVIREEIAAIAAECGLDEAQVADVRLAVSEVASNVVLHAYRGVDGEIRVRAAYADEQLQVVIADDGPGIAPRIDSPGLGLGLPIVAAVAQSFEVQSGGDGTEVHLTFPCPDGAGLP